jgi:hypothetical protein
MEKLKIELTEKEARLLYGCLIRTHAKGEMLDVGEKVEKIIVDYLDDKK